MQSYRADVIGSLLRPDYLLRAREEHRAGRLGMLLDPHQRQWFARKGFDPDRMIDDGIEMINAIIAGHPGVTFGLHICRGNDASRYMAKGSYAKVAALVFRRAQPAVRLCIGGARQRDYIGCSGAKAAVGRGGCQRGLAQLTRPPGVVSYRSIGTPTRLPHSVQEPS